MILDRLPEVQALSREEKAVLTQELLDDLNAPTISGEQESAILEVLNARFEAYRSDPSTALPWVEVRERLIARTGASWRTSILTTESSTAWKVRE